MVIALLFLLFCALIGSTVLAASAANAGRVQSQAAAEQAALNQRSLAGICRKELTAPDGGKNRLYIQFIETEATPIGEAALEASESDEIDHTLFGMTDKKWIAAVDTHDSAENRSVLREILFESAVECWIAENEAGVLPDMVTYVNFKKELLPNSFADAALSPLQLTLTDPMGEEIPMALACLSGEDDKYDFVITFGKKPQLHIRAYASVSETTADVFTDPIPKNSGGTEYLQTTKIYTTAIEWNRIEIIKGGVEE